jgi:hypothetical protein
MRAHAYLPAVFLALAACATAPTVPPDASLPLPPGPLFAPTLPPADPALVLAVEGIRTEVRKVHEAQAEALWRAWAEGATVDPTGLAGRDELYAAETVGAVRRVREGTVDPVERRALLFLETYLAGEHLARATAVETSRIAARLATATVTTGELTVPFADLDVRLAAEPDRERRAALERAAAPVLREVEALRWAEEQAIDRAIRTLGYRGYADLGVALRQMELERMAALARKFLDDTEAPYRKAFAEAARRELGLSPEEVRRSDVPRLWRGIGYDAGFPRVRSLPAVEATLAGLGLELRDARVRLDDGERPGKVERPLCVPVRVPGDVRLSVRPAAGVAGWAGLLHEVGHAQHFAHAANGTFELDVLGNHVTGDAFALLFEGLLEDPAWLEAHSDLGRPERPAFLATEATKKLYLLRQYAARTVFEYEWRIGRLGNGPPRDAWRRHMEAALGFPLSPDDAFRWALRDEDFFASADHLRAFLLAAMLEDRLSQSFGPRWWQEPAAGRFLQSLWSTGNRDRPLELARTLGYPSLDPTPLIRRLTDAVSVPAPAAAPASPPAAVSARP